MRHDLCSGPPCVCYQCHVKRIIAKTHKDLAIPPGRAGREQLVANDARALLALLEQRRRYAAKRADARLPPFACGCGRTIDGKRCTITDARTRKRVYRAPACREFARRGRLRVQARARAMAEAAEAVREAHCPPTPAVNSRVPSWR